MPKLTALTVKAAGVGLHADSAARGLYLRVTDSGARSWVFRFQKDGRRHSMGLAPTATVSLRAAREKVAELRLVLRGRTGSDERAQPS